MRRLQRRRGGPIAGTGVGFALRAMGYTGHFQAIRPLEPTLWRQSAPGLLQGFEDVPGGVWVEVGDPEPGALNLAVAQVVSRALLLFPMVNRARLQGRIYQRTTGEIMVHTSPGLDDVRSFVFEASSLPQRSMWNTWRRALRGVARVYGHPLEPVAYRLLRRWADVGFIASPAGAMISPVGEAGIDFGWSPLIPANGIPLAITVCRPVDGRAFLGIRPDHRVLDAIHLGAVYQHLKMEVPRWLDFARRRRGTRRRTSSTRFSASPSQGRVDSATLREIVAGGRSTGSPRPSTQTHGKTDPPRWTMRRRSTSGTTGPGSHRSRGSCPGPRQRSSTIRSTGAPEGARTRSRSSRFSSASSPMGSWARRRSGLRSRPRTWRSARSSGTCGDGIWFGSRRTIRASRASAAAGSAGWIFWEDS